MEVKTLNIKSFKLDCQKLISSIDFKPDLIIGILNGGKYLINEIKKNEDFKHLNFKFIKLQRSTTSAKNNIFIKTLFRKIPYNILNALRVIESKKVASSISKINKRSLDSRKISFGFDETINNKKILLIDDALDSGKTMYIVKNNLSRICNLKNVKSAVISWTIEDSIVKPDFYIYKNVLIRFPFSKDYKGTKLNE